MEKNSLVKKVIAIMEYEEAVVKFFDKINEVEKLKSKLIKIKFDTAQTLKMLTLLKNEGVFKKHWLLKDMEEVWRDWARKQGIKEGDFLFEN